jgi:hypothetical protein
MLPDAFLFNYGKRGGDLIQLNFTPSRSFHPPTREAEVFHAMEGSVWVNGKQARVEEITGQLIHEVKFAGGLLGHLNKGGTFLVKQAEVAPGYWELTLLKVQMKGKALFFKTIGVHHDYSRSDFRQIPDNLTLARQQIFFAPQTLQSYLLPLRFAKLACAAIGEVALTVLRTPEISRFREGFEQASQALEFSHHECRTGGPWTDMHCPGSVSQTFKEIFIGAVVASGKQKIGL